MFNRPSLSIFSAIADVVIKETIRASCKTPNYRESYLGIILIGGFKKITQAVFK